MHATFAAPLRLAAPRRAARGCVVTAAAQSAGAAHALGSRVRVVAPVTVYHAPKCKNGLQLQNLVGTVEKYSDLNADGSALLSSTQPLVVRFEVPGPEGKPVGIVAHFTPSEVESA